MTSAIYTLVVVANIRPWLQFTSDLTSTLMLSSSMLVICEYLVLICSFLLDMFSMILAVKASSSFIVETGGVLDNNGEGGNSDLELLSVSQSGDRVLKNSFLLFCISMLTLWLPVGVRGVQTGLGSV